jgi:hypothetical protein
MKRLHPSKTIEIISDKGILLQLPLVLAYYKGFYSEIDNA